MRAGPGEFERDRAETWGPPAGQWRLARRYADRRPGRAQRRARSADPDRGGRRGGRGGSREWTVRGRPRSTDSGPCSGRSRGYDYSRPKSLHNFRPPEESADVLWPRPLGPPTRPGMRSRLRTRGLRRSTTTCRRVLSRARVGSWLPLLSADEILRVGDQGIPGLLRRGCEAGHVGRFEECLALSDRFSTRPGLAEPPAQIVGRTEESRQLVSLGQVRGDAPDHGRRVRGRVPGERMQSSERRTGGPASATASQSGPARIEKPPYTAPP